MKFEFDTETDGPKEAAALAAALAVLHGDEVAKLLDAAATRIEVGDVVVRAPENFDPSKLAVDGRPVEDDASAADAFGGEPQHDVNSANAVTLDTAGIPWDERIHASTKTTNKDGTWTRRRNTDDALFDKVMAELKGGSNAAEAILAPRQEANAADAFVDPTLPASSPAVIVPPPPAATESSPADTTSDVPVAPSNPVPPPPPAPAASTDPITFPKLMVKITKAQTAQTIDAAKVVEFLGMFGLSAVKELASAPAETIQAVNDLVDAHVGS